MQTLFRKIIIVLFLFILSFSQKALCQSDKILLKQADSLFNLKRYNESFDLYQKLWQEQQYYTPKMLLKMAYIKENMGDPAGALYYINLYHIQKPEKDITIKMKGLADKYNFIGYNYNDFDYMIFIYQRYKIYIITLLLAAAFIFFLTLIIKKRTGEIVMYHPLIFFIFLLVSFLMINLADKYKKGIINGDMVYLMSAPSAGASLFQTIGKGHRVTIKGKEDVWYEIVWQGEETYIHQKDLLVIER